jgi:hypothetical protein
VKSLQEFKDKMAQFAADADGRPKPGPDDCQTCGEKAPLVFKDYMSKKEFAISGMCQICQDQIFEDADSFDVPDDYPVF